MIHQQHIRAYVRRLAMVRRKGLSFRFYAYGTPSACSDVDLLMIMPCGNAASIRRQKPNPTRPNFLLTCWCAVPKKCRNVWPWAIALCAKSLLKAEYETADARMD